MNTYIAIAYRWGESNNHQYMFYAGTDLEKAREAADHECSYRGGKYGCAVLEVGQPDESGEQPMKYVAYYPSMMCRKDQTVPEHNHNADMLLSLGRAFIEFSKGRAWIAEDHPTMKSRDGTPMRVMNPHPVDPPQWVVEEVKRQEEIRDAWSRLPQARTGEPQAVCGNCKYRGKNIVSEEWVGNTIEDVATEYFLCDRMKHLNDMNPNEITKGEPAGVTDGSGYYAALCVSTDFGCNQWEAA